LSSSSSFKLSPVLDVLLGLGALFTSPEDKSTPLFIPILEFTPLKDPDACSGIVTVALEMLTFGPAKIGVN